MKVCLNLSADVSKFTDSAFFQTLDQDVVEKEPHIIKGDITTFGYLFSPSVIDFENILEYWNLGSYYDLKIDDLMKKIIEHMNLRIERSPWLFEQLITIHQRTHGKLSIKPLFNEAIYLLKQNV